MNASEFATKWKASQATERAAAHEHFIDLCALLNEPTPNTDPTSEMYAFEKGASKTSGGDGWADVWRRGRFAWEYKGKHKDLKAAYKQLLDYREALQNPPLLVVCDLNRFEVHTNFTNTVAVVLTFDLDDLLHRPGKPLSILKAVMSDPDSLRPTRTPADLTEQAAAAFARLAEDLRDKGHDPQAVAHFLNKLLFCLFAEDAGLLPPNLVRQLAEATKTTPAAFSVQLADLFSKMSSKPGGFFGVHQIQWFNGGLFDGSDVLPLDRKTIVVIADVAQLDWSQIEPSIFGTLFERGLDPSKRSQMGAHYTDRASIERVVVPVVLEPLEVEFEAMQVRALAAVSKIDLKADLYGAERAQRTKAVDRARREVTTFQDRLASYRILDPACGSGNFLYVALQALKDLERRALVWASTELGLTQEHPRVGPSVVHGIELNSYAAELARVSIWIGEIQWMIANGYGYLKDPVLRPLESVEQRDAVLHDDGTIADWPASDVIIGNPPFSGSQKMRADLGDRYVDALRDAWRDRLPGSADYCLYWFEKAREMIASGNAKRAGLLGTQGIRFGHNRTVLDRIKATGDIFMAWDDEPWVVEGADVHVSIVGFDNGTQAQRHLDGRPVATINSDLTAGLDLTKAARLGENRAIAFQGIVKVGKFEIRPDLAANLLAQTNPDGRTNADVIKPWINGADLSERPSRRLYIIDFPDTLSQFEASLYQAPFEYLRAVVKPSRDENRSPSRKQYWWRLGRSGRDVRAAVSGLSRYLATVRHSKHRIWRWVPRGTVPDSALVVVARDDDYAFGVLQALPHTWWSLRKGSQVRERESGFRYTPESTFETYAWPSASRRQQETISDVAKRLNELREQWIAADPERRSLTLLYNEVPGWLQLLHTELDRAVFDAYAWPYPLSEDDVLGRLLDLNIRRGALNANSDPVALS